MSLPRTKQETSASPLSKLPDRHTDRHTDSKPSEAKLEAAKQEKARSLGAALAEIEKSYGKGSIMRLGDDSLIKEIKGISTGSPSLDLALGGKGLPRGRVVEIFGPESSGKTTLSLHVIANAQMEGGICAFVDAEHAMDPAYARKLGVKLDDLLVSQPDTGEQALEIVDALVRSDAIDVIVIDSVAALVPRAEIEGEMGDSFVGLHARLMSQALRKLTGSIARSNTLVIFINQIREKIGVMFGSPETTTGGRALKFYASVRLDIRRIGQLKEAEEVVGARTKVTVVKNKIAPPFRKVEFDILFDHGISREGDLIDLGSTNGAILKSGTWLSFKHPTEGEIRLGQGRERARAFLLDNPELTLEITKAVMAKARPLALVPETPAPTPIAGASPLASDRPVNAPVVKPAAKPVPPTPAPAPTK
ncbi:MAG: recombinase RecA [Planctomycetes bacterium]|nr:recombinase RecA [Planctomycetota bacterium]